MAGTGQVTKTHGPPETARSPSSWSPELLGPGKGTKRTAYPGLCPCGTPENLSCLDLGSARNSGPTWHLGQCPCRAPWRQISLDPGSTCCLGLWQTQCGPSTVSTCHTCQRYLFAVSLPLHNTTEQVSLNKRPPSAPCIRVEIRH